MCECNSNYCNVDWTTYEPVITGSAVGGTYTGGWTYSPYTFKYYTCPRCFNLVTGGTKYCPNCGHDFNAPSNYTVDTLGNRGWICPKCGKVFGPHVDECEYCNTPPTITYTTTIGK